MLTRPRHDPRPATLLWVDCTAAALAGTAVLALSGWLSQLHELPRELLLFIGAVNLLYASFSFTLARRNVRPLPLIRLLVYANATWAVVCSGLAATFVDRASPYGLAHLAGEGVFVGGLAVLEWRRRYQLAATGARRSALDDKAPA